MPNRVFGMQTKLDQVMALLTKLTIQTTTTTAAAAFAAPPTAPSAPTAPPSQPPELQSELPCENRFKPLAQSPASSESLSEEDNAAATTPPPNQEQWKRGQKQKKQSSQNGKNRKRAFKATVLSDSVLTKVDVKTTEDLSSDANCNFLHDAGDIDVAIRCVEKETLSRSDQLIIHTGTNNIRGEGVFGICRRLENLESSLQYQSYQRVALSSIVYRRCGRRVREKIGMLNDAILGI
jgi:hypothetical protein